jgi:hypothetical protein
VNTVNLSVLQKAKNFIADLLAVGLSTGILLWALLISVRGGRSLSGRRAFVLLLRKLELVDCCTGKLA